MIEKLRQEGVLTEAEMLTHPDKSRLLKCVGGPRDPSVSLGQETLLNPGDVILLCTDGLWEALPQETIVGYLHKGELGDSVVDMLLAAEAARGDSSDNITAVAFRWDDDMSREMPLQAETVSVVNQLELERSAKLKPVPRKPANTTAEPQSPADGAGGKPTDLGDSVHSLEQELEELESYVGKIIPPDKK